MIHRKGSNWQMSKKVIMKLSTIMQKLIKKMSIGESEKILLPHIIANINYDTSNNQKKVLISYLDLCITAENISTGKIHTNNLELYKIIQYFISRNYCIDVCACNDISALEYARKQRYDIIFGLGKVYRGLWEQNAFHIQYMTENPYSISYEKEKERLDYLYERKGMKADFCRTGKYYQEHDEERADMIICTGDPRYYQQTGKLVRRTWPSAMINKTVIDFTNRKQNSFLVLGSNGFVHKGNDLLIEVFNKHSEWELYLCGNNVTEQAGEYGYSLNQNVHDCGYIDIQSKQFVELVEKCTFILLPSCSEAPSTAVMTGMCHGMIPIIMHGNGMDELTEYCEFFDDYRIKSIEEKLQEVQKMKDEEIIMREKKVQEYACSKYTLNLFYEQFADIMDTITG